MTKKQSVQSKIEASLEDTRRRIAEHLAGRLEQDAQEAVNTLARLVRDGDVNSVRHAAAKTILEMAGVFQNSRTVSASATGPSGRVEVVVVEHQRPGIAADDD